MRSHAIAVGLSGLDWITPAVSLAKCMTGDWRPISVFWSDQPPVHWQRVLEGVGIRTSPGSINPDGFVLLVPLGDVPMALSVLQGAGAPLA
jgi:hypothetical protein